VIKIGIITDKYHFEHKISEFLKYLKTKANITVYLEESLILTLNSLNFEENIFFVKAKGDLTINLVRYIEKETDIPIINSHKGILLAINRFLNSLYLKKAGILVPDFSLNPSGIKPPFNNFIVKNIIDKKTYTFTPKIRKVRGSLQIYDDRALNEESSGDEQYHYLFYQKFIKSKWEYKVYGIGDNFYFYKQIPVLINPNKMESRKKINEIPELKEISKKAMEILNLKIASIDFLKSIEGNYYLTDINCTPNFNYIKDGPKIVADYLLKQGKN